MINSIIGRKQEQESLLNLYHSKEAEFVAIYGRRRVGKTFLVNSLFANDFLFKVTAILSNNLQQQLENFSKALKEYSSMKVPPITSWFDAFGILRNLLEKSKKKRKVIFIDEIPWLDTKRSNFVSALEHFWNGWASAQNEIMFIICGSDISWIVKKLFQNRGGLHNRITRRILLKPFTLAECRQYFESKGYHIDELSLLEMYMVFGGIPYYLNLIDKRLSIAQNIDRLCFIQEGELRGEFINLYTSVFGNTSQHLAVLEALGKKRLG